MEERLQSASDSGGRGWGGGVDEVYGHTGRQATALFDAVVSRFSGRQAHVYVGESLGWHGCHITLASRALSK